MKKLYYIMLCIIIIIFGAAIRTRMMDYQQPAVRIDSYHYLGMAEGKTEHTGEMTFLALISKYAPNIIYVVPVLMYFIVILMLWYCFHKVQANDYSVILFLLLSIVSYTILSATKFNLFDKDPFNMIYMMLWVIFILHIESMQELRNKKKIYIPVACFVTLIIIGMFFWNGIMIFFIILCYSLYPASYMSTGKFSKYDKIMLSIVSVLIIIVYFVNIKQIFIVSELRPIILSVLTFEKLFIIFFPSIIILGIISYLRLSKYKEPGYALLMSFFICTYIAMMTMNRFIVYFFPVMMIVICSKFDIKDKKDQILYIIMFILFAVTFVSRWDDDMINSQELRMSIGSANSYPCDCIITDWGIGHIVDYYSTKNVVLKGHPNNLKRFTDAVVYGNTECCIIYNEDMKYLVDSHVFIGEWWVNNDMPVSNNSLYEVHVP